MTKIITWISNTISNSRKGIEDLIISIIPQAVTLVTGLVTTILVARGLGPNGMGKYALILSVSSLIASLSDLGIGQTAIRFASRAAALGDTENQHAILRWAFRLRVTLALLISLLTFTLVPFIAEKLWHAKDLTFLLRISLLTGIFGAIGSVPMIYFQSLKQFKMNTIVSVGQTLISLTGIIIIAILSMWKLENIIVVSVVATGLGAFTFLMIVPKNIFFSLDEFKNFQKKKISHLFKAPSQNNLNSESIDASGVESFTFFMFLSSLAVMITMRADVWIMGFFLNKSQIGLYSVATRFTLPLVMVLNALNTILWPRASHLTDRQQIITLLRKTFRICLLFALGVIIYSVFIPLMTPWIFGDNYNGAILLAQILCIRYCISFLLCPIGIIGYSFGLVRVYWLINLIQLVIVVGANFILIPRVGIMGSVIALVLNEFIGFIIMGAIILKKSKCVIK